MSEEKTPLGATQSEIERRAEDALKAGIDSIISKERDKWLGQAAEVIQRHAEVDRSEVPEFHNRGGESVVKTASPYEPLYRSMPEAEQKIRNPDFDHWSREFFVGVLDRDSARTLQSRAKIAELNPNYSRADLLEGAADATGGFADDSSGGGKLLPRPLEDLVAIARDKVAKMARYATTYTMTAQEHNVPTGAAMTAYMQGETTSPSTTGFTAAQVPLIAHRGVAKAIVGTDLLADSAVNVVSFITRRAGAALGVLEDEQFFKDGTGTAPNVTKLTGTAYAEATTNALAFADVVGMWNAVTQPYRDGAVWFAASDVLGFLATVVDTTGRQLYQSLFDAPMGISDTNDGNANTRATSTLLNHPIHEVPLTPGEIWFGNPAAKYAIGRRAGITVESSRDFLFDTYRTVFLIQQRFAGNNIDTTAGCAQLAAGITSATV